MQSRGWALPLPPGFRAGPLPHPHIHGVRSRGWAQRGHGAQLGAATHPTAPPAPRTPPPRPPALWGRAALGPAPRPDGELGAAHVPGCVSRRPARLQAGGGRRSSSSSSKSMCRRGVMGPSWRPFLGNRSPSLGKPPRAPAEPHRAPPTGLRSPSASPRSPPGCRQRAMGWGTGGRRARAGWVQGGWARDGGCHATSILRRHGNPSPSQLGCSSPR